MNKLMKSNIKSNNNHYSQFLCETYLKNKFLNLAKASHNANGHPTNLNVFNIKLKKSDSYGKTMKEKVINNFIGKARHYPPANKE